MLGELVTAGLGPEHVDTLYDLCERVRAAEQDKDPPPPGRPKHPLMLIRLRLLCLSRKHVAVPATHWVIRVLRQHR